MLRSFNPPDVAPPASRYSHCVEVTGAARWLVISGQVGVTPEASVCEGLAAQLAQCFANIDAGLRAANMTKNNLVKLTVYVTVGGAEALGIYRRGRDSWLGENGPVPTGTYVVVAGLASEVFLVEVEALAAAGQD